MTREEYVKLRNENPLEIMYNYYIENHKSGKKYDYTEFCNAFLNWPGANSAWVNLINQYDIKFNIVALQDLQTRQIIKYL